MSVTGQRCVNKHDEHSPSIKVGNVTSSATVRFSCRIPLHEVKLQELRMHEWRQEEGKNEKKNIQNITKSNYIKEKNKNDK
jgi:hypothetical protein